MTVGRKGKGDGERGRGKMEGRGRESLCEKLGWGSNKQTNRAHSGCPNFLFFFFGHHTAPGLVEGYRRSRFRFNHNVQGAGLSGDVMQGTPFGVEWGAVL